MSDKNECVGSYPVSGYTRSDGTEVSGYVRRCGAKHNGSYENKQKNELTAEKIKINDKLYHQVLVNITEKLNLSSCECMKYYHLSLDFENKKKFDRDNNFIKFKKISDNNLKSIMKEICDLNINDNTDVVIPKYGSKFYNDIINSIEFNDIIQKNLSKIKNGDFKNKNIPIAFNFSSDLRLTLGHATIYNLHYYNGAFCGTLFDAYNFEHKTVRMCKKYDIYNPFFLLINNDAYSLQQKGLVKNYVILVPMLKFENFL